MMWVASVPLWIISAIFMLFALATAILDFDAYQKSERRNVKSNQIAFFSSLAISCVVAVVAALIARL